jgi:hypothetical protein
MKPVYKDEVFLLGWSETHNGGAKVTFLLPDSSALEPFKLMTVAKGKTAGQRLACVLVEIGDDEQPAVEQPAKTEEKKTRVHSKWLAMRLKEAEFRAFLQIHYEVQINNEAEADQFVKQLLGIQSKTEIDDVPAVYHRFIATIMEDWKAWNEL